MSHARAEISQSTILLPPPPEAEYHATYQRRMIGIRSLPVLQQFIAYWLPLVEDAAEVVARLDDAWWPAFRLGAEMYLLEYKYPGETWEYEFGAVLFPEVLCEVAQVAAVQKIPWGAAYNRMSYAGLLAQGDDGFVRLTEAALTAEGSM